MKFKAKRNDSWLGITKDKIYDLDTLILDVGTGKNNKVRKMLVKTDGYTVGYHQDDFEILEDE